MTEPTLQERLRQVHREITDSDGGESPLMAMIREAADALDAAQAEVERLREALLAQKAADDASMTGPNDKGYFHWQELENKAKDLAAKALGRTP